MQGNEKLDLIMNEKKLKYVSESMKQSAILHASK